MRGCDVSADREPAGEYSEAPRKSSGCCYSASGDAAPLPELTEKLSVFLPSREAVVGRAGGAHTREEVCESWGAPVKQLLQRLGDAEEELIFTSSWIGCVVLLSLLSCRRE